MIERESIRSESEHRSHYQEMLPAGLFLGDRLASDLRFGELFLAKDLRSGARDGVSRSIRFLPPQDPGRHGEAWNDWSLWRGAFLDRMAHFIGLQIPHFAAPVDVTSHASGTVYVVSPYHRRSVAELIDASQNGIPAQQACLILEEALSALAGLHARELVHADVRPQNIFLEPLIDGNGMASIWLGDPTEGALQICSRNRLHDPRRGRYYSSHGVSELLPKGDLYALARVACEMSLPQAEEVLEACNETPSADSLWAAYGQSLRRQFRTSGFIGGFKDLFVGAACDSQQLLRVTVATLLGESIAESPWQPLIPRLHSIAVEQPEDAVKAITRLRLQKSKRDRSRRRLSTTGTVALIVLAIAFLLEFACVRRLQSDLQDARSSTAKAQEDLAAAEANIARKDSSIDDLKLQLDRKEASERTQELHDIRSDLDKIKMNVEAIAKHQVPTRAAETRLNADPNTSPRSEAKDGWRAAFGDSTYRTYDKKRSQRLFEQWRQKDARVADLIREWKQGADGSAGLDGLLRLAKPWLDAKADSALNRLSDEASAAPWEKLNEAFKRWNVLQKAAERWEACTKPGVDPQQVIDQQPDDDVKKVLRTWYEKLLRTTQWSLQLVEGKTLLDARLPPSRVISIYATSEIVGDRHDWHTGDKALPGCESSFQYGLSAVGLRNLSFDWWWGAERKSIQLYVESDWHWYTAGVKPNLIAQTFDGPLAIWKLDQAAIAKSSDGKTTLSFRVIDCPGPPRGWNVNRAVAKSKIEAAIQVLPKKGTP